MARKRDTDRTLLSVATAVGAAAGVVASLTAVGAVGVAYYVAHALTSPRRPTATDDYVVTPFETGIPFDDVTIMPDAGDEGGHRLPGWWLPRPETKRVVVGCAGYRGSKSDLVGIGSALWRAGFNVLLFDYYGHGADRGAPVTLGFREVRDFFRALDYVHQRLPDAELGVIGYSMGASVAIMGSARRPEVRAVVADSPFMTHADVVAHNISRVTHLPGAPLAQLTDLFLWRTAGYHNRDVAPIRDVAAIAPRPLLLIHGTADTTIPIEHTERIFAVAGEPKELWIAEGAEHCGAYFLDRPAYCERVVAFFDRWLAPAPATPPTRRESPADALADRRI